MKVIERYFKKRQSLIEQYVKGDMDKSEYLQENLDLVDDVGIKPFKEVDTVEKALYNYQYYNAYAKYAQGISCIRRISKDKANAFRRKTQFYYEKKDCATMQVLALLEYKNVIAYFIQSRSKDLSGKLVEILLDDKENGMILHSVKSEILETLRKNNVFIEETRKSVIDSYINQKY